MMLVPGLSRLRAAAVAAAAVIAAMAVAVCGCGGGGQGGDAIDGALSDVSAQDAAARDAGGDAWTDLDGRDPRDQGAPDASASADPARRLRDSGWLSGDLHMHSTYSDGEDPVAVTVGLAEYFQNPVFLAAHPEYVGNPVDFIALTDHRTAAGDSDPTYASDRVILIPGEEFGGPGHVGMYGVTATIPHDPGGDGPTLGDYYGGMEIAAMQGAVRTINHPCRVGNPFGWNLHDVDAVEVWNMAWNGCQRGRQRHLLKLSLTKPERSTGLVLWS